MCKSINDGEVAGFYLACANYTDQGFCKNNGCQIGCFGPKIAHLLLIAVDNKMRKQGIGKLMLFDCMKRFHQQTFIGLAWNVFSFNKGAQQFYEKIGAIVASHKPRYKSMILHCNNCKIACGSFLYSWPQKLLYLFFGIHPNITKKILEKICNNFREDSDWVDGISEGSVCAGS